MSPFTEYIQHGWKLCRIRPGEKGPRTPGWNLQENALPSGEGVLSAGLMHAYSGTCALDVDDAEKAADWLWQNAGIALHITLQCAPDKVEINRGHPNKFKLLFALPEPLPTKTFADGAFELRCGTTSGKTAQDVLPPSKHPSGAEYQWIGDWRNLPPIPEKLLALWKSVLVQTPAEFTKREQTAELNDLRALISKRSPDCGYDEWIKVGMALHHETGGSEDGLALWDEWSAPSDKYPGYDNLVSHWNSFGSSETPVTADFLRKGDIATADEFEVLTADEFEVLTEEVDWLSGASLERTAQAAEAFRFLPLAELFARPEPSWIIPGVLPQAGVGAIYGQPGGGKTFLAVDAALSIALGEPWRGLPVVQGSTLYIAAEDDMGVQVRLQAGIDARSVQDAPIKVLTTAPVLTDPLQAKGLQVAILAEKRPALIFFDTLAAVTPGSDENSGKDMSKIIHYCHQLHKLTGALVMLVHHEGKTIGRGLRGWSGLHGACEVEWEVTAGDDGKRELHIAKLKNAPTGATYPFRLLPVGKSCVVEWI